MPEAPTTFATRQEALDAAQAAKDVIGRLPVAGLSSLDPALGAAERLIGGIHAVELVEPAEAAGTHRYRQVHSLAPIEEETTNG